MTEPVLYPYQITGAEWLTKNPRALLSDEMGLGKSAQAIRACDMLGLNDILIIAPASVVLNWRAEFEKFSPRYRDQSPIDGHMRVVTVSYEHISKNLLHYAMAKWDVVICDEAHYLKNPTATRTKDLLGVGGVVHRADRFWLLTGTPMPNNASELWVMLFTFGKTKLGFEAFVDRYCHSVQIHPKRRQVTGTKTEMIPELRALMHSFSLRRTKDEVLTDMPDLTIGDIFIRHDECTLQFPPEVFEQMKLEQKILFDKFEIGGIREDQTEAEVLASLTALAPSVSTLRRYFGMQKAQAVALRLTQELEDHAYDKLIIFAVHHDVIDLLAKHFNNPAIITGSTPQPKRQAEIKRFQNDPNCQVFIGNIGAAGTGITLTAAHHVVFVESDWVPGNNAQAMMRAHRIGQLKNVLVRFVTLHDSIDEKINRVLKRKSREIALMLNPDLQ